MRASGLARRLSRRPNTLAAAVNEFLAAQNGSASSTQLAAVPLRPSIEALASANPALPVPWIGLRLFSSLPTHTELSMPALSPTMSQGNLVAWHVKEGQEIAPGDVLADVETDKATLSWENQDEGFVAKLLVAEGAQNIAVGTPVALLVDEAEAVAAFKDYAPAAARGGAAEAAAPAAAEVPPPAPTAPRNSRIGPAARTLLETSGIPAELVNPTGPNGIITKGDVLAAIEAGVKPPAADKTKAAAAPPPQQPQQPQQQQQQQRQQAPADAAPRAPAAPAPPPQPPAGATYTDVPNSQIRKIIAQRLQESKQTIPHLYVSADVDLEGVNGLRQALKQQGAKVSVNDCVIKAVALALADVPAANCYWDVAQQAAVPTGAVDISIAVATDTGLITPIIRGADKKPLQQIAAEVRELAGRARANRLKPEEFQGGSFSISNLGMFGVDKFFAIINPPQACIMAVGGARQVATLQGGQPASRSQMTVTLSADNRVYDGEVASQFLAAFSRHIANPYRLFQ
ncbi:hypothetical protein ABPG77_007126 [Micractinium sp. CCAP 211/92]